MRTYLIRQSHVHGNTNISDTTGAHRAHIALAELKIPFEEEIIDLSVPRTPEYLAINPRGLVPSLSYNGQIITESAIVAQFLADAYPSHLVPNAGTPEAALTRARINFFVDTFFSKVNSLYHKALFAKTNEEAEEASAEFVKQLEKEVEPLLSDAGPYFGGSKTLTLAEVCYQKNKIEKSLKEHNCTDTNELMTGPYRIFHSAIALSTEEWHWPREFDQRTAYQDTQLLQVGNYSGRAPQCEWNLE